MSWRILNLILMYQVLALVVVTVGCLVFWQEGVFAAFLGGGFGAVNFYSLKQLVQRGFTGDGKNKSAYAFALGLKTITALGVLAMLMMTFKLNPIAFALGLSTMFVGFGLATVHATLQKPAAKQG